MDMNRWLWLTLVPIPFWAKGLPMSTTYNTLPFRLAHVATLTLKESLPIKSDIKCTGSRNKVRTSPEVDHCNLDNANLLHYAYAFGEGDDIT